MFTSIMLLRIRISSVSSALYWVTLYPVTEAELPSMLL